MAESESQEPPAGQCEDRASDSDSTVPETSASSQTLVMKKAKPSPLQKKMSSVKSFFRGMLNSGAEGGETHHARDSNLSDQSKEGNNTIGERLLPLESSLVTLIDETSKLDQEQALLKEKTTVLSSSQDKVTRQIKESLLVIQQELKAYKVDTMKAQDGALAIVQAEAQVMREELNELKTSNVALQAQLSEIITLLHKQRCDPKPDNTASGAMAKPPPETNSQPVPRADGVKQEPESGTHVESPQGRQENQDPPRAESPITNADISPEVPHSGLPPSLPPSHPPPMTTSTVAEDPQDQREWTVVTNRRNRASGPGENVQRLPKIHDPLSTRRPAHVVMICDSVTQHVDRERFFGPKWVAIRRIGSVEKAEPVIKTWATSNVVQNFIIHLGNNDVRKGRETSEITAGLKSCMKIAARKCPRASVLFSELV